MTDHEMQGHEGHDMAGHDMPGHDMAGAGLNAMAISATLHCLTGCAIGEVLGLVIGTAYGWGDVATLVLAVGLAFLFGYSLSTLPLLRAGAGPWAALRLVFAADTLSIATMELVDNGVMLVIPGAMEAGLVDATFWASMLLALTVAGLAAWPVNRALLSRGKGHALTHAYHGGAAPTGWRRAVPAISTSTLVASIVAFMLGAMLVSVAADDTRGGSGEKDAPGRHDNPSHDKDKQDRGKGHR
jgi:hypothetical protein